jgi:hypothetical protein
MNAYSVWRSVDQVEPGKYLVSVVTISRDGAVFPPCESETAWAADRTAAQEAMEDMVRLAIDRVVARGGTVVQLS